jgi:WD40 repeat protein
MKMEEDLHSKIVQIIHSHAADVLSCCFYGRVLATTSGDKLVRLWSFESGKNASGNDSEGYFNELPQSPLCGHSYAVNFCHFTPMGTLLVSCSQDGKAMVWDVRTGRRLFTVEHPSRQSIRIGQFSPDSRILATGSDDESLCLWDVSSRKLISCVEGHEASIVALSFSPDSNFIMTGSTQGDLRFWECKFGQGRHLLHIPEAHDLGVMSCQFSPRFGAQGATLELGGNTMYMLASGGNDNLVKLWRVFVGVDGEVSMTVYTVLEGHSQNVMCVTFSPDGTFLASSGGDKLVIIWDPIKGYPLHKIDHHERYVPCCAFSSDGGLIASGSNDKTVAIWKLYRGEEQTEQPLIDFDEVSYSVQQQLLNGPRSATTWTADDVCSWLGSLHLGQYRDAFRRNGIDGQELFHLDDAMLKDSLGMDLLGHRNKLLRGIRSLRDVYCAPPESPSSSSNGGRVSFELPKRELEQPDEYYCPIRHEIMRDPVIAADGYTYEREAIQAWIDSGKRTSPMTNAPMGHFELTPNRSLKMLIQKS